MEGDLFFFNGNAIDYLIYISLFGFLYQGRYVLQIGTLHINMMPFITPKIGTNHENLEKLDKSLFLGGAYFESFLVRGGATKSPLLFE